MASSRLLCNAALLFLSITQAALAPHDAGARSLDAQVERLLNNDCSQLGLFGGTTGGVPPTDIGPNLDRVCRTNSPDTVASAGGGAASSQASTAAIKGQRALERLEEERDGSASATARIAEMFAVDGLGIWSSIDLTERDRRITPFEDGFKSDVWGASLGVDYRVNDALLLGIAANYQRTDGKFEGGGGFDTNAYGGVLYGSLTPTPEIFVDVAVSLDGRDYEVERAVRFTEFELGNPTATLSGIASSDTNGWESSGRLLAGYVFTRGSTTVEPRAGVNYVYSEVENFRESGGTGLELVYGKRVRESVQASAGLAASLVASTDFGVLVPQLDFDYVHEFEDDQRVYRARFAEDLRATPLVFGFENEKPDRNFFRLGFGVSMVLPRGLQVFVQYRTLLSHAYFDSHGVAVGARLELGGDAP